MAKLNDTEINGSLTISDELHVDDRNILEEIDNKISPMDFSTVTELQFTLSETPAIFTAEENVYILVQGISFANAGWISIANTAGVALGQTTLPAGFLTSAYVGWIYVPKGKSVQYSGSADSAVFKIVQILN